MLKKKLVLFLSVVLLFTTTAREVISEPMEAFKVLLLTNPGSPKVFEQLVIDETRVLLGERFNLQFQVEELPFSNIDQITARIDGYMAENSLDCIVGLSLGASEALIRYGTYPKPVIAGAVLDRYMQGLRMTADGTSGIHNFNYIQSPFNVEKDLRTFKQLIDFKNLAVLYQDGEDVMFHNIYSYLGKAVEKAAPGASFNLIDLEGLSIEGAVDAIDKNTDAVYLAFVSTDINKDQQRKFLSLINERKLPTFSLLGETSVQLGALASIAPDRNIKAISRRIAINLLGISRGENPGEQKVSISKYTDNFVVNVGTMRQIDYFPDWDALEDARLINLVGSQQGRAITLRSVIEEALKANLDLQIARLDTELRQQETGLARAPLLPQINLATSLSSIDDNRANGIAGSSAPHTWTATGSISQILFSDDLLANHEIQKILLESQQFQETTQLLDTVVTAAEAYIRVLFARSNHVIINTNLSVTRKNLDIARNKAAVGSIGASDVHRWETELAQNQIDLNDGYRDLELASMALNQVLNRTIKEPFKAEDIEPESAIELMITDPEVYRYLENFQKLSKFGNFLTLEADRNLPELHEIEAVLRSQQRAELNSKRAFYLPDVQLTGRIDKILDEYDTEFSTPSDADHPWTITATASWPLFEGNKRRHDLSSKRLAVRQTKLQTRNLRNQLHLQVRSNLETAAVSAREVELSTEAAEAARKNFEIIQAGYSEGRNSIADLIDAQNAKTSSEQGQAIAKYQFVLDFLQLERSSGRFHFLDSAPEKTAFISRLQEHMDMSD